jgi:glycosyltransferase involved in cell wall biosynthesis
MSSPRVSVIMCSYNVAPYMDEAIASVIHQTFEDFELLIVDDGSKDATPEISRKWEKQDRRVRYVPHAKNGGAGKAHNTGLYEAKGEYLTFCDADDVHFPFRLAAHVALLDQSPDVGNVFSDFSTWIDGKVTDVSSLRKRKLGPSRRSFDEEIARAFPPPKTAGERNVPVPPEHKNALVYQGRVASLLSLMHVSWSGVSMYRRRAMLGVGGYDESLRNYHDWYVSSLIAKGWELMFLDVPVILYRQHSSQLTKQSRITNEGYLKVAERVWRSDPIAFSQNRDNIRRVLGVAHWQLGQNWAQEGKWTDAAGEFIRSIQAYPRQRRVYLDLAKALVRSRIPR